MRDVLTVNHGQIFGKGEFYGVSLLTQKIHEQNNTTKHTCIMMACIVDCLDCSKFLCIRTFAELINIV